MKSIKYIFGIYNPLLWKNITVYSVHSDGKISKIFTFLLLTIANDWYIIK